MGVGCQGVEAQRGGWKGSRGWKEGESQRQGVVELANRKWAETILELVWTPTASPSQRELAGASQVYLKGPECTGVEQTARGALFIV